MQRKTMWALGLALLACHPALCQPALAQPKFLPNLDQPPTAQPQSKPSQPNGAQSNGAQPGQIAAPQSSEVIAFESAGPAFRYWASSDYLMWWVHRGPTPVLLTTAPNNGLNANGLTGGNGESGTRRLALSCYPARDQEGAATGVAIIAVDVTANLRAEHSLD